MPVFAVRGERGAIHTQVFTVLANLVLIVEVRILACFAFLSGAELGIGST